ncbi:MAG: DASH family cryptochrome [Bacteroidota bacterium]
MKKIGIILFTSDLRLHDNAPVLQAIKENDEVIPLYCWDENYMNSEQFGFKRMGDIRRGFLQKALEDLHQGFKSIGGYLLVKKGNQFKVIQELLTHYSVYKIYTKKQVGIEEKRENERLKKMLLTKGVDFEEYSTSTVYHPSDLPFSMSSIPEIFTKFRKIVEKEASVRQSLPVPQSISCPLIRNDVQELNSLNYVLAVDERNSLPAFGGESMSLKHLNAYLFFGKHILHYKETRNELLGSAFSSKLSHWLALGCISPKFIYHEVKRFEYEVESNDSTYWLIFELLWRDFFRFSFKKHPIDYFQLHGILGRSERKDVNDPKLIESWINGETPNTFVNAAMKELKLTGWTSNRMRQIVASYFIYDLEQDWRIGAAYFESQLIDYDVSSNWGNWAYIAGVGNDPRAGRKFNTEKQEEQYDKNKRYQFLWNKV